MGRPIVARGPGGRAVKFRLHVNSDSSVVARLMRGKKTLTERRFLARTGWNTARLPVRRAVRAGWSWIVVVLRSRNGQRDFARRVYIPPR